ncbi:MAG: hypothetical protein HN985_06470 [Planctomycetaceae bacterium]|jgi:hypothetical protein|nr:hypothetical protein [Planctomycetaceae bacterium]MBT6919351.1 hypothetical protein [Planctomycetaceae bacterium]MBT7727639.1 hypothetical protein [Planctomycetaceae bacterium]
MKLLYASLLAGVLATSIAGEKTEPETWGMVQFQPTILGWVESQVNAHNARLHKEGQPIEIVVRKGLPNTLQLTVYHKSNVTIGALNKAIDETKYRADGEMLAVVEMMLNTNQPMPEGLRNWIRELNNRATEKVSLNSWLKDNRWYEFEEKRIDIDALEKTN